MDSTQKSKSMTSPRQMKLIEAHLATLKVPFEKAYRKRLRYGTTFKEASAIISNLEIKIRIVGNLTTRDISGGRSTNSQILRFMKRREEMQTPISENELFKLILLTSGEMTLLCQQAEKDFQDQNDRAGVPVPEWRVRNNLYDPELIESYRRAKEQREQAARVEREQARSASRRANLDRLRETDPRKYAKAMKAIQKANPYDYI